jgi:Ca-activated chloride channel family protein
VVTGQRESKAKRPPFSLVVVLDRSGSMAGEKMTSSKASIKSIIDRLDDDDDLSFVVFDDKLSVIFAHGDLRKGREELKAQVDAVKSNGSTNLSGGMVVGGLALGCQPYEVGPFTRAAAGDLGFLADVPHEGKNARRMFLFSDGEANKGLTGKDELAKLASDICEAGATISTFGIGRDFNEAIMAQIARSGHGGFTYVKKANLIEQYVGDALGNMQMLIGTSAKLTVRGCGTAVVRRVYDHTGNVASLKDMRENNKIQVVVQLSVSPSDAVPPSPTDTILEWELTYTSSETGAEVKMTGKVSADFTRDAAAAAVVNPVARSAVLQLQSGEMDNEITILLEAGKRAEAIEKKKAALKLLEEAVALDPNGFAKVMLAAGQKTLSQLESTRSANKVKKAVQYGGYLQRRASISAMDQLNDYVAEEDSSSEEDDAKSNMFQQQQQGPRGAGINIRRLS